MTSPPPVPWTPDEDRQQSSAPIPWTPEEDKKKAKADKEGPPPEEPILPAIAAKGERPEPGMLRKGAAFAARIGGPLIGGALGAVEGGIGAYPGYFGGGAAGEYIAQKLEGKDTNMKEVGISGLLSMIPGLGLGRKGTAAKSLLEKGLWHGAEGAAQGALGATGRSLIEKGELPSGGELAQQAAFGAPLGAVIGVGADKFWHGPPPTIKEKEPFKPSSKTIAEHEAALQENKARQAWEFKGQDAKGNVREATVYVNADDPEVVRRIVANPASQINNIDSEGRRILQYWDTPELLSKVSIKPKTVPEPGPPATKVKGYERPEPEYGRSEQTSPLPGAPEKPMPGDVEVGPNTPSDKGNPLYKKHLDVEGWGARRVEAIVPKTWDSEFAGKSVADLPDKYLQWLINRMPNLYPEVKANIAKEIDYRARHGIAGPEWHRPEVKGKAKEGEVPEWMKEVFGDEGEGKTLQSLGENQGSNLDDEDYVTLARHLGSNNVADGSHLQRGWASGLKSVDDSILFDYVDDFIRASSKFGPSPQDEWHWSPDDRRGWDLPTLFDNYKSPEAMKFREGALAAAEEMRTRRSVGRGKTFQSIEKKEGPPPEAPAAEGKKLEEVQGKKERGQVLMLHSGGMADMPVPMSIKNVEPTESGKFSEETGPAARKGLAKYSAYEPDTVYNDPGGPQTEVRRAGTVPGGYYYKDNNDNVWAIQVSKEEEAKLLAKQPFKARITEFSHPGQKWKQEGGVTHVQSKERYVELTQDKSPRGTQLESSMGPPPEEGAPDLRGGKGYYPEVEVQPHQIYKDERGNPVTQEFVVLPKSGTPAVAMSNHLEPLSQSGVREGLKAQFMGKPPGPEEAEVLRRQIAKAGTEQILTPEGKLIEEPGAEGKREKLARLEPSKPPLPIKEGQAPPPPGPPTKHGEVVGSKLVPAEAPQGKGIHWFTDKKTGETYPKYRGKRISIEEARNRGWEPATAKVEGEWQGALTPEAGGIMPEGVPQGIMGRTTEPMSERRPVRNPNTGQIEMRGNGKWVQKPGGEAYQEKYIDHINKVTIRGRVKEKPGGEWVWVGEHKAEDWHPGADESASELQIRKAEGQLTRQVGTEKVGPPPKTAELHGPPRPRHYTQQIQEEGKVVRKRTELQGKEPPPAEVKGVEPEYTIDPKTGEKVYKAAGTHPTKMEGPPPEAAAAEFPPGKGPGTPKYKSPEEHKFEALKKENRDLPGVQTLISQGASRTEIVAHIKAIKKAKTNQSVWPIGAEKKVEGPRQKEILRHLDELGVHVDLEVGGIKEPEINLAKRLVRIPVGQTVRGLDAAAEAVGKVAGKLASMPPVGATAVNVREQLTKDSLARSVIKRLAGSKSFALTGSPAYAFQGKLPRVGGTTFHDLDFMTIPGRSFDSAKAEFKSSIPEAVQVRPDFKPDELASFLVPNEGYSLVTGGDRNSPTSIHVKNEATGETTPWKGQADNTVRVVDLFSPTRNPDFKPSDVITVNAPGVGEMPVVHYAIGFKHKLDWLRSKDAEDWFGFRPGPGDRALDRDLTFQTGTQGPPPKTPLTTQHIVSTIRDSIKNAGGDNSMFEFKPSESNPKQVEMTIKGYPAQEGKPGPTLARVWLDTEKKQILVNREDWEHNYPGQEQPAEGPVGQAKILKMKDGKYPIPNQAIIELTEGAGISDVHHEIWHVFENLAGLAWQEVKLLSKVLPKLEGRSPEESRAYWYGVWKTPTERLREKFGNLPSSDTFAGKVIDDVYSKIYQMGLGLKMAIRPGSKVAAEAYKENLFMQVRSGKAWAERYSPSWRLNRALETAEFIQKGQSKLIAKNLAAKAEQMADIQALKREGKITNEEAGYWEKRIERELAAPNFAAQVPKLTEYIRQQVGPVMQKLEGRLDRTADLKVFDRARARTALATLASPVPLQENEIELLRKLSSGQNPAILKAIDINKQVSGAWDYLGRTVGKVPPAAADSLKVISASWDLSNNLRQNLFTAAANPKAAFRSLATQISSLRSEAHAEAAMAAIHDEAALMGKYNPLTHGLVLNDWKTTKTYGAERAEQFQASQVVQDFLHRYVPGIAISDRAFAVGINKIRFDAAKDLWQRFEAMGYNPERDEQVFRAITDLVNTSTGRGDFTKETGALSKTLGEAIFGGGNRESILSKILWSPRLVESRMSLLNPNNLSAERGRWGLRGTGDLEAGRVLTNEHRKTLATVFGTVASIVALQDFAARVIGDGKPTTDWDPVSSDFLKNKIGKDQSWRIDALGGAQQYVVLAARLMSGATKTASGKPLFSGEYGASSGTEKVAEFLAKKTTPAFRAFMDAAGGQDSLGKTLTFSPQIIPYLATGKDFNREGKPPTALGEQTYYSLRQLFLDNLPPLSLKDANNVLDDLRDGKLDTGTAAMLASLGVLGTSIYSTQTKAENSQYSPSLWGPPPPRRLPSAIGKAEKRQFYRGVLESPNSAMAAAAKAGKSWLAGPPPAQPQQP